MERSTLNWTHIMTNILNDFYNLRIKVDNMQNKIINIFINTIQQNFLDIDIRFLNTKYDLTFHNITYLVNNICYKINISYNTFINIDNINEDDLESYLSEHIQANINKSVLDNINNIAKQIESLHYNDRQSLFELLKSKYRLNYNE